jgi:hypothetical protein
VAVLEEILRGLAETDDLTWRCEVVRRAATEGRSAELYDLGLRLHAHPADTWAVSHLLDYVRQALALTPAGDNAATAVRLLRATSPKPGTVRAIAARLAAAQPLEAVLPLLVAEDAEEPAACLTHELVLRHPGVGEAEEVRERHRRMAAAGHPLAALPVRLLEIEHDLPLPNYGLDGWSYGLPFGPHSDRAPRRRAPVSRAEELTTPADAELIASAVANWTTESNGRIEARVFRLPEPATLDGDLLDALGLQALDGEGGIAARQAAPADVMRILFAAASVGGAYGGGQGGAYGRLLAWRSLAGLTGAPAADEVDDVAARAGECAWLTFDADTEWFHAVVWDLGIAALRPDGRTVAVLAGTDTD